VTARSVPPSFWPTSTTSGRRIGPIPLTRRSAEQKRIHGQNVERL
jgi:hypothetical protein